jgi:Na+/proline symporter
MGWVNLAMAKILMLILGVSKTEAILFVLGLTALTCIISTLSGLAGVQVMDAVQFLIMISMAIALAVFAVGAVGGIDAMKDKLTQPGHGTPLEFFPASDAAWMPLLTFFVYLAVNWWATWYPGAAPGGDGYIAQRIFSTRSERDSVLATLWFNIAHYALRPWPWVLSTGNTDSDISTIFRSTLPRRGISTPGRPPGHSPQ